LGQQAIQYVCLYKGKVGSLEQVCVCVCQK